MELLLTKIKRPFQELSFKEDTHKYFIKNEPLKGSVSNLIHNFIEPVDFDAIAPYSAIKAGVTTEEIKRQWKEKNDESKVRGHRVHSFGENYQFNRTLTPSCPQEVAITKFWEDLPEYIIPIAAEFRMYHFKNKFGGTSDIILYDTLNNGYIIADYKTNEDLYKNFKEKTLLAPFTNLLDCPLNHYQIQLSYYQLMLEQADIKVVNRVIIWLKLDGTYEMIFTEDLTSKLKPLLN